MKHFLARLATLACGGDEDLQLRLYGRLTDVLPEPGRTNGPLHRLVLTAGRTADDSLRFQLGCP